MCDLFKSYILAFCFFILANIFVAVKFKLFGYNVLFYEYNYLILIFVFVFCIFVYLLKVFSKFIIFNATCISLLTALLFNILFVTTIERSLSVNVLSSLCNADSGVPLRVLKRDVENFFVKNSGFDKRMHEQGEINTIKIDGERVFITSKGRILCDINKVIATIFSIGGSNHDDRRYIAQ